MKNECGKMRKVEEPYEIWRSFGGDWEWHVLKKWQVDDNKPYARWFCAVYSPITREQCASGYEMGDVYVSDIKGYARRVK